jgi:hypothetical protein
MWDLSLNIESSHAVQSCKTFSEDCGMVDCGEGFQIPTLIEDGTPTTLRLCLRAYELDGDTHVYVYEGASTKISSNFVY